MADTLTLADILRPSQELNGVRYFNGEAAILLGAAVSDLGRDYDIPVPVTGTDWSNDEKINKVIEAIYAGVKKLDEETLESRLLLIQDRIPELGREVLEAEGHFYYNDSRDEPATERVFDPRGEYSDLPEKFVGRLVSKHFTTMSKLIRGSLVTPRYVGEVGERVNGLELTYFNRRYFSPRGYYPHETGVFIYDFLDEEGHLVVWKTGKDVEFERGGSYTVIGGTVKAHDRYRDEPPKTVLTRAKFHNNRTNDRVG